jgi:Protein of unknown function (DUF3667)
VSHSKERKEKDCLNCGAEVQGRFCHICGQENIETNETFWGLITHFVYDITHFDGKFFSTLKYLLLRPGFLSKEYQRGKRSSYLHPIKMYVFTSAVFFFVLFSFVDEDDFVNVKGSDIPAYRDSLRQKMKLTTDSIQWKQLSDSLHRTDSTMVILEELKVVEKDPTISDSLRWAILSKTQLPNTNVAYWNGLAKTVEEYDSVQLSKPVKERDGWLKQYSIRKIIQLNIKSKNNRVGMIKTVTNKFLHSLPKMMFISLPFLALFISLLYIRQKRTHYVHHGILVVHGYIAMYILILLYLSVSYLTGKMETWGVGAVVMFLLAAYMFYYNYKSLRVFFEQSRIKTIFKFLILVFLTFMLFMFLSSIFVINSLLQA